MISNVFLIVMEIKVFDLNLGNTEGFCATVPRGTASDRILRVGPQAAEALLQPPYVTSQLNN